MKTRSQISCCIGYRVDKSGPRPPVRNQAGVKKYAPGTNLPKDSLQGYQNCVKVNSGTSEITKSCKKKDLIRKKWTREEYKGIMEAYCYAKYHPPDKSNTKQTYTIWRKNNLNNKQYIDANKLANVRRQILRDKRLTDR